MIDATTLAAATGATFRRATWWLTPINVTMGIFAIDSPQRIAAFLAQIGHESGRLVYSREIWGPTPAQIRYEGRADLGNVQTGDGRTYAGRGLIQITGRANYIAVRDGLRAYIPTVPDFEAMPAMLEVPVWAAHSAGWFWAMHGCNELADAGSFMTITRRINGGVNGYDDRVALWNSGKSAMGVTA